MSVILTSEQIAIDRIKIAKDWEPDEEIVRQLMLSILAVGVLQPPALCRPSPGLGIHLVFGRNRIEACKRLKHRALIARVVNGNTDEIKAWCVQAARDENMVRRISSLPPDPRVVSLIDRKRAVAS
jgi:ParB-like chromosome segregation protein Spo0J